jgi:hypothetical protein
MVAPIAVAIVEGIFGAISGLFKSKEDEAEAKIRILDLVSKSDQAQMEVNKVEASSESLWVSGWRPLCGWTSGFVVMVLPVIIHLWNYIGAPICGLPPMPQLDANIYSTVLFGLLGISTARTVEKVVKK